MNHSFTKKSIEKVSSHSPLKPYRLNPGKELWIKWESHRPPYLHKSRIYQNLKEPGGDKNFNNFKGFSIGSCGNSSKVATFYAEKLGIPLKRFIPAPFLPYLVPDPQERNLEKYPLIPVSGTYEMALLESKKWCEMNRGWFDISVNSDFYREFVHLYQAIPKEVFASLPTIHQRRFFWSIPVGDGGTLLQILKGSESEKPLNQYFWGVSSPGNNSIYESVSNHLQSHKKLDPKSLSIHPCSIPFLNWDSTFGDECVSKLNSRGGVLGFSPKEVEKAQEAFLAEGLKLGPVSTHTMLGARELFANHDPIFPGETLTVIAILTD